MPATFNLELHFPLPPTVPPDLVIRTLHAYEPLIRPNPYLQGFARQPVDLEDVVADPFFTEDGTNITGYEIHDRIPILPALGLAKDVRFPAIFQAFATGVRVRADAAAGTRVRSIYEVCPRPSQEQVDGGGGAGGGAEQLDGGPTGTAGRGYSGASGWDLVERSHVECSALLKPFIVRSFEAGHRDLVGKVIENIVETASGPTQKELPPLPQGLEQEAGL